jgi:hypothetical protein
VGVLRVCVLIASSAVLSVHRQEVGGLYVIFLFHIQGEWPYTLFDRGSVRWIGVATDQCGLVALCTAIFSDNERVCIAVIGCAVWGPA